jgi:two-component system chemotaxis sensor kinase CheA
MESEILQEFIREAEIYLPAIRGGILVCSQESYTNGELSASLRQVQTVKHAAASIDLGDIENAAERLEVELEPLVVAKERLSEEQSRMLLDKLAVLEANLTKISFSPDFFPAEFVDESFENLGIGTPRNGTEQAVEEFEIDDEMLEVFTIEAEDLLRNMNLHLAVLEQNPESGDALLEVRRDAHTLKGSAGIVGLKKLSGLAHRVEDLLDFLAENKLDTNPQVFELLVTATDCFEKLANGETSIQLEKKIERLYKNLDGAFALLKLAKANPTGVEGKTNPAANEPLIQQPAHSRPMIRVSLEKLDELVKIVGALRVGRSIFEQKIAAAEQTSLDALKANFQSLFENQRQLVDEMQEKLLRLRLVKFGALSARLQRTVRSTCEDEAKYANLLIEGDEFEFDTQVLDSLVEPLLHLLRNAVAHGIESPETRRLLGKEEFGKIFLSVSADESHINLTVSDDGRGISAASLIEKAIQNNFVTEDEAGEMTEQEIFALVFLPGLTTAEKLSQVAGRGVGMNIVKTAVSRSKGEISVFSKPHKGTIFKIRLPLALQLKPVGEAVQIPRENAPVNLKVMIVDDSPGMRLRTARLIKSAGWQTIIATDGFEAMEILQGSVEPPDIILSDVEMPRMNGFELLQFLRHRKSLSEVPIIMITSRDADNDRKRAFDLGVSEYLTKPYEDEALLEKIKDLAMTRRSFI